MTEKVLFDSVHIATFKCPECKTAKTINVSKFIGTNDVLQIKCKCGHSNAIALETRKDVRKALNLVGSYVSPKTKKRGQIRVINMSQAGLSFRCYEPQEFKSGDKLLL